MYGQILRKRLPIYYFAHAHTAYNQSNWMWFCCEEKGEGITQIHFNILANRVLDSDADCAFLYTFYLPFLLQKIER